MQITDEFFETQIIWPYLAAAGHNVDGRKSGNSNNSGNSKNDIISNSGNSISTSGSDTVATPRLIHQQQKQK